MKEKKTGQIFRGEIKLTLTIGFIISILIAGAIGWYYAATAKKTPDQKKELREEISFLVTVVGIGAGVTSAFYAADTITRNSQTNKISRAITLLSEWNNMDLQVYKDLLGTLRHNTYGLQESEKSIIINGIIESKREIYEGKVIEYLNFLEYIAILVENECVEEEIIRDYFCTIFDKAEDLLGTWIVQRQKNSNNNKIYENFINVNRRWNS
jgi:hypothetical protein